MRLQKEHANYTFTNLRGENEVMGMDHQKTLWRLLNDVKIGEEVLFDDNTHVVFKLSGDGCFAYPLQNPTCMIYISSVNLYK
jgi:hypothetical protein